MAGMSTAILLIVFVAFVGRVVLSAMAMRNWLAVVALTLLAAAICAGAAYLGFSLRPSLDFLYRTGGAGMFVLVDAVIFAIGYGVPTMLRHAEERRQKWSAPALLAAMLLTVFAVVLWWESMRYLPPHVMAEPGTWFIIGAACFVVFQSEFYDRSTVQ